MNWIMFILEKVTKRRRLMLLKQRTGNTFRLKDLKNDIRQNPQYYSAWLKICLPEVIKKFMEQYKSDL